MKKILLVHPEGNINNNPNLTGIVEILCERDYEIHYYYAPKDYVPQYYAPCRNVILFPVNEASIQTNSFFVRNNYDLVIGVDRGIIPASSIAKRQNIPYGLISYELYFAEETGDEFKKTEIDACRDLAFAVCQDRLRSSLLSKENNIPIGKIIDIPVAGRPVKDRERTHTLHDLLGIDKSRKIALYMGEPTAQWAGFGELMESADNWNDRWALVLHQRYGNYDQSALETINKTRKKNVYISPMPSLTFKEMHLLLNAADLGLAFYFPRGENFSDGKNLLHVGMASGKISTYLQHGLPVIINPIGEMSGHVRRYELGAVVDKLQDIPLLLENLPDDRLSSWRHNCLRFFEEKLDLNMTINPLLKVISSLSGSGAPSQVEFTSKESPADRMTFDASIIIATKNRARLLDAMLASLEKAAGEVNYEVIVIEGGSSDNTLEVLRKHGIAQIYQEAGYFGEGRHSWSQLYNFGFSKAKGKWAMFASDDITFSGKCLSQAVELLNKQADTVAGGIFFYKNVFAEPGWDDFGIDYTYGQKLLLNYGLVRLDLFRDNKGLDELYDFYCADGDLCLKLYEQGRQFIPLPNCFVIHNNVADTQKQVNIDAAQKDIDRYTDRWKHFVPTAAVPNPRRLMWRDFPAKSSPSADELSETDKEPVCRSETSDLLDRLRTSGLWKNGDLLRLHLGCGEQYLAGYINIDYPQSEHNVMKIKADIYTDITKLDFPCASVDEIRLHHVFEHFSRVMALALLIRWHQWLKIGGRLFIETPDLIGAAKMLLSEAPWRYKTAAVRHITGDQAAQWGYHVDQWFPERFEHTLQKFGFDHIETKSVSWDHEPFLANVHATGLKTRTLPIHSLLQAADEILKESMVSDEEQATYDVWRSQLREIIETVKTDSVSKTSEELELTESLKKDFRNVKTLVRLAVIEIDRGNTRKAKNYLLAAKALDPRNKTALSLLGRL